jgi:hypothetical protein
VVKIMGRKQKQPLFFNITIEKVHTQSPESMIFPARVPMNLRVVDVIGVKQRQPLFFSCSSRASKLYGPSPTALDFAALDEGKTGLVIEKVHTKSPEA